MQSKLLFCFYKNSTELPNRRAYGDITTAHFMTYTPANFVNAGVLPKDVRAAAHSQEALRKAMVGKLTLVMNIVEDLE
jgi:hypothetical protein